MLTLSLGVAVQYVFGRQLHIKTQLENFEEWLQMSLYENPYSSYVQLTAAQFPGKKWHSFMAMGNLRSMESPNAISFFVVIFMKGASRIKFQVRRQVTFLNITERCHSQLSHFNDRGRLDRYCPSIVHYSLPASPD